MAGSDPYCVRFLPLTGEARRAHEATDHRNSLPNVCAECRRRAKVAFAEELLAEGKLIRG